MEFKVYPFNTLEDYFSADIMAVYKGKWIFCKHKEKSTWENPAGYVEIGETTLETAKRELYEETGAIDFDIEPLCDYYINAEATASVITPPPIALMRWGWLLPKARQIF